MSRAINLKLPEADVISKCQAAGVSISAIEPLPSGGTHLVCATSDGADEMRLKFKDHILTAKQKRFPFFVPQSRWK